MFEFKEGKKIQLQIHLRRIEG